MHEDLPEEIHTKIGPPNPRDDLQEAEVAMVFVNEDERPYLTRRQVNSRLEEDYSRGTINSKLTGLVEVDVLDSDELKRGNIYWLKNQESSWPLPDDVEVYPPSNELTVDEFFEEWSVRVAIWGITVILIASVMVWIGAYLAGSGVNPPLISTAIILATGLGAIFFGWLMIGYGIVRWFRESPIGHYDD